MSALLIDDGVRKLIKAASERAFKNPMSREQIMDLVQRTPQQANHLDFKSRPKAMNRAHRPEEILIPVGYRVCFSVEDQPHGLVRHLSVSVNKAGMLPHMLAVGMIAEAFEFRLGASADERVWTEEYEPGRYAVNVAELVEPTKDEGGANGNDEQRITDNSA